MFPLLCSSVCSDLPYSLQIPSKWMDDSSIYTHSNSPNLFPPCRVVRAMGIWLAIAKADLIKDPTFQKLLHYLQDSLAKDGLVEELKEVNMRLMDSIRRGPTLTHDGGKVSTHLSLVCHVTDY